MSREGDYYLVNLANQAGRKEIVPYVDQVIRNFTQLGTVVSPTGRSVPKDILGTDESDDIFDRPTITPAGIRQIFSEYIIDLDHDDTPGKVADVVNFMLFDERNPEHENPFNPQAAELHDVFVATHDPLSQEIARELWEYEQREALRRQLEFRVKRNIDIRIIGQLASGKTTFLHTVSRELALEEANLGVSASEPEDLENDYPELAVQNSYEYARDLSRGAEATFGTETVQLFSYATHNGDLAEVTIHSSGGHVRADRPYDYIDFSVAAFFIDYHLMEQLTQLDTATDPQTVLENNETVLETVRSLLARLQDWHQVDGAKLGVLTKLPHGQPITKKMFEVVNRAYKRVLAYAEAHYEEITDDFIYSEGMELDPTMLDPQDVRKTASEWWPIYDDEPTFSGTVQVAKRLTELAVLGEKKKVLGETQLVTFDPTNNNPGLIYYEQLPNNNDSTTKRNDTYDQGTIFNANM